jgi:hypothetical protein
MDIRTADMDILMEDTRTDIRTVDMFQPLQLITDTRTGILMEIMGILMVTRMEILMAIILPEIWQSCRVPSCTFWLIQWVPLALLFQLF